MRAFACPSERLVFCSLFTASRWEADHNPQLLDGIFDSRAFTGKASSSKSRVKQEEEATPDLEAPPVASSSTAGAAGAEAVPVAVGDLASDVKMEGLEDVPAVPAIPAVPAVPAVTSRSSSRSGKSREVVKEVNNEKRIKLLVAGPESRTLVIKRYYALLLPTLVDVYAASVNSQVRTKALLGLLKIVNFCDGESLTAILKVSWISISSLFN